MPPVAATRAQDASGITSADPRCAELRRLVDSGDFDVLSLDVFDTLVWRGVPEPRDVFFLVAERLRARGYAFESSTAESFVRERMEAERRARERQPSREVTLAEIYAEFPAGYLCGTTPADVLDLELEVEGDVVRLDAATVDLMDHARQCGLQVALVSDTYFTARQIRSLTGVEPDHVFASCEHRRAKRDGLHQLLIERTRVKPERVLHVGDNFEADVAGPGLGIARYWLRRFPDEYRSLLELELPEPLSRRVEFTAASDRGLSTLRGRVMFRCATPHERWGAGVLGPVIAGFSEWVALRCRALEIRTALCPMREGRMLRAMLALADPGLEAREIFVSRFVALQAAILDGSETELGRFLARPSPPSLGTLLAQLGLERDALPGRNPEQRLTPAEVKALARRVAGDRALRASTMRASAEVRARLIRHLESQGALQGTLAIVDLGYNGTIQECLERILARERPGLATHGLYLVTAGGVHRAQSTGCAIEGWLAENGQPVGMAHSFVRSPEIAEQSLMADCGTTIGFDADGTPRLDQVRVPERQRGEILEVQEGVRRFARAWSELRAAHGALAPETFRRFARAIAMRMVSRPLPVELDLFGGWAHDENLGSGAARALTAIADLHLWEERHLSAHQLASLPHERVIWPFGYAATVSDTMRDAVAAIYQRLADPSVFDSGLAARPIGLFWDAGGGYHPRASRVADVRLNNRGRAWHRFRLTVTGEPLRAVAVAIGSRDELVQLTGMRVHLRSRDGALETRSFEAEALAKVGYSQLHGNLYRVEQEPALMVAPLELERFTGWVDVDVFFGLLEAA